MKKKVFSYSCLLLFIFTVNSCSRNYPENAIGFTKIANNLKSKFGENACYTNITVLNSSTTGTIINVSVAGKTSSKKTGEYNYMHGSWNRVADVNISENKEDAMFDITEDINMSLLGDLIEMSKEFVRNEKNISEINFRLASVMIPPESNKNNLNYSIILKPEDGNNTFTFLYNNKGELLKKIY